MGGGRIWPWSVGVACSIEYGVWVWHVVCVGVSCDMGYGVWVWHGVWDMGCGCGM